jgi:GNAT superfamily N-acetyltransferase
VTYRAPRPLAREHQLDGFRSVSAEQTAWLARHARQSVAASMTRVLVVTPYESDDVVAYYAWTMAHLDRAAVPERMRAGTGRYPQPIALLARLAVDREHEGRGLGAALLADVIGRTVAIGDGIGCRGLLVHCESDTARAFYRHLVPEFLDSPTDPLHLVLRMKDLRRSLAGGR